MSVLITGGTGWIGSHLLSKFDFPLVVSRNANAAASRTGLPLEQIIGCDLGQQSIPKDRMKGVRTVVNLMGDSIAEGRWTDEKKKRIRDSRVVGTRNLTESILNSDELPEVVISASAVGYYGDQGDIAIDESHAAADDFLSQVCLEWEQAAQPLVKAGIRVCFLRIGIVIGKGGGAIEKMLTPFKLGVGGRIGNGMQFMPWIHLDDLIAMILFLIETDSCMGPFNATAPNPVRNKDFTKSLGKALKRPSIFPAPRFALRLAFGEFADYLCASQRVIPSAFNSAGFKFRYADIDTALHETVNE